MMDERLARHRTCTIQNTWADCCKLASLPSTHSSTLFPLLQSSRCSAPSTTFKKPMPFTVMYTYSSAQVERRFIAIRGRSGACPCLSFCFTFLLDRTWTCSAADGRPLPLTLSPLLFSRSVFFTTAAPFSHDARAGLRVECRHRLLSLAPVCFYFFVESPALRQAFLSSLLPRHGGGLRVNVFFSSPGLGRPSTHAMYGPPIWHGRGRGRRGAASPCRPRPRRPTSHGLAQARARVSGFQR